MMPQLRRLALVGTPMVFLSGLIFSIAILAPTLLANQPRVTPPQPMLFDHSIHVQTAGIECTFCHRTASQGVTAGYPDVQQCMFCHQVIATSQTPAQGMDLSQTQAELSKVRAAWQTQQGIVWERIHRLPDHVRFLHEAHITAGLDCATCHGDVKKMGQVTQVRPLGMGDCIGCHREKGAPTECAICHK